MLAASIEWPCYLLCYLDTDSCNCVYVSVSDIIVHNFTLILVCWQLKLSYLVLRIRAGLPYEVWDTSFLCHRVSSCWVLNHAFIYMHNEFPKLHHKHNKFCHISFVLLVNIVSSINWQSMLLHHNCGIFLPKLAIWIRKGWNCLCQGSN